MSSTAPADIFDEVFDSEGIPRAHAEELVAELERLGADSLVAAGALRDAIFTHPTMAEGLVSLFASPPKAPDSN